jgi:hypothetical protein
MSALLGFEKEVPSKECKECKTIFYRKEEQSSPSWFNQIFCNKECNANWTKNDPKTIQKAKERRNKPENLIKNKILNKEKRKKLKEFWKENPEEYEKHKNHARNYKRKKYAEDPKFRRKQNELSKKLVKKYYAEDPKYREKQWAHSLKRNFGMTLGEYDKMNKLQNKVCAICKNSDCNNKKNTHLNVDHDHKTGNIRELLGSKCNMVLGLVSDNITILENMIKYLHKHKSLDK